MFARADRVAASLGHQCTGSDHLLVAMAESDAGLCTELLSREGLDLAKLAERAHWEQDDAGDSDPPAARTSYLEDVARMAHEHAVVLESESVSANHALLAIAVGGKGSAAAILADLPEGATTRVASTLLDAFGGIEFAPPTVTTREALALAWSRAHATGAEEIEVTDLLHGLSAPGWTKGARAIAALGTPPNWAPVLWTEAEPNEPYRRIPLGERAKRALHRAGDEATNLGRKFTGGEHLLLAISVEAMEDLRPFVGRQVGVEQVRGAVAAAVRRTEEAYDAEARRRGWTPEPARTFAERVLAAAEEAVEAGAAVSPVEGGPPPGCWPGLMATIQLNDDGDLAELLDDMELAPAEVHALARDEIDRSFADVIERAGEGRPGEELQPVDVILAAVSAGSPRVRSALDRLGLTSNEVMAQLSEWRLSAGGDNLGTASVLVATGLNLLLGAVTSIALLEVVIDHGTWWKLLFLPLVWSGYPNYGPAGSIVVAGILGFAVSPLVGGLHLLGIPADLIQARAERRAIWARTGTRLNLRELRCVSRRALGQMGRINQGFRQILRSELRKGLRRTRRSR
jgi:hypothetical protein